MARGHCASAASPGSGRRRCGGPRSRRRRRRVFACCPPGASRRSCRFVGLADLVRDDFAAVADELTEHDRGALAVAVGLAAPEGPPDAIAVPRAFSAFLRLLARDRPVLLAVDDVQWLDSSSRRALSFAARRLGDAPIGIVVTQRGEGPDPLDLARALDETRFGELRVEPRAWARSRT
jgi:AAA ATPase domain